MFEPNPVYFDLDTKPMDFTDDWTEQTRDNDQPAGETDHWSNEFTIGEEEQTELDQHATSGFNQADSIERIQPERVQVIVKSEGSIDQCNNACDYCSTTSSVCPPSTVIVSPPHFRSSASVDSSF